MCVPAYIYKTETHTKKFKKLNHFLVYQKLTQHCHQLQKQQYPQTYLEARVVESQGWLLIDGYAGEGRWWVDPSTKRRRVTGLKGSPLRIVVKQLIVCGLAEQRLQKRRRRRRLRTEDKSGGNSVSTSHATPRHHSLKPTRLVFRPA